MLTHTRHTLHTFTHHAYTNRVRTSFLVPLRTRLPLMTSCASGNSTLVPTSGMATVSNGATTGIGSADPSPAAFTARPRFASQSNAFPVLNIMPATQTHTTTNTTTNNNMANHATASAGHLRHFSSASAMISPTNATTRAGHLQQCACAMDRVKQTFEERVGCSPSLLLLLCFPHPRPLVAHLVSNSSPLNPTPPSNYEHTYLRIWSLYRHESHLTGWYRFFFFGRRDGCSRDALTE